MLNILLKSLPSVASTAKIYKSLWNKLFNVELTMDFVCSGCTLLFYETYGRSSSSADQELSPRYALLADDSIVQAVPEHPRKEHVFCLSNSYGDVYLFQVREPPAHWETWFYWSILECSTSISSCGVGTFLRFSLHSFILWSLSSNCCLHLFSHRCGSFVSSVNERGVASHQHLVFSPQTSTLWDFLCVSFCW